MAHSTSDISGILTADNHISLPHELMLLIGASYTHLLLNQKHLLTNDMSLLEFGLSQQREQSEAAVMSAFHDQWRFANQINSCKLTSLSVITKNCVRQYKIQPELILNIGQPPSSYTLAGIITIAKTNSQSFQIKGLTKKHNIISTFLISLRISATANCIPG